MIAARPITLFAALLAAAAVTTTARAEDWELAPDGASVADHDAGLVWGALNSSFGGPVSVAWATAEAGCRQYGLTAFNATGQYSTGWRMPTLAEAQLAASHNAWYYFNLAWGEGDPACWTSTAQKKNYWALRFMTGATGLLAEKNGRADFRPVRSLESWTYRADLGGWLDNQTGLVWGPGSTDIIPGGIIFTWNGAVNRLPEYRERTGIAAFRLPTLAEVQTAISHNAIVYFEQTMVEPYNRYWTSDNGGKVKGIESASVGRFHLGTTELIGKNSGVRFMCVYRP